MQSYNSILVPRLVSTTLLHLTEMDQVHSCGFYNEVQVPNDTPSSKYKITRAKGCCSA